MNDTALQQPATPGMAREVAPGVAWLALPIVNVYLLGEPGAGDRCHDPAGVGLRRTRQAL